MALDPPFALLPVLQCLHALSFGATHLGAIAFVVQMAPPEFGARAQGYVAVGHGLVMAGAMALSGVLYARYGHAAYAAMAVMAAAGAACALAAKRRQGRS
jgi:PPP family 3-phenylpropionic acid transporter